MLKQLGHVRERVPLRYTLEFCFAKLMLCPSEAQHPIGKPKTVKKFELIYELIRKKFNNVIAIQHHL